MYQTEAQLREERTRRLLYIFFGISVFISASICGLILFFVLVPEQGKREVGRASEFAVGEVEERPVQRLNTSQLLPAAPNWSDDIVFVVRQADGEYRAFLGIDPQSGCKLNWREHQDAFVDTNCSQTEYSITGHNQSDPVTLASQPHHMLELPVEVQGDMVYVIDRILRRDRQ